MLTLYCHKLKLMSTEIVTAKMNNLTMLVQFVYQFRSSSVARNLRRGGGNDNKCE